MLYFKNIELSRKYSVSLGTIRNWIEAAQAGKLSLGLLTDGDKTYIANTAKNVALMAKMAEDGRKYRNTHAAKVVKPDTKFYDLFSEEQTYDIISNLEINKEIPRQYNYFDIGAERWNQYMNRLISEETPNTLTSTIRLLDLNKGYIDNLLSSYDRVNIIDVGVGNAYPVKNLLAGMLESNKLGRYIALDISPTMLEVAKRNISSWFGDKVRFEGYTYDLNYDRFVNLLADEYAQKESQNTVNLVLLLGGTLINMRYPDNGYRMIHDSMGIDDLLIHSAKLDTETSRHYFDFNNTPGSTALSPNHRLIFDLLNIDESFYEVEMGYNPDIRQRYIRARLKIAMTIRFSFKGSRKNVRFNKGDTILLWRAIQLTARDVLTQFERNDFYPFHMSQTDEQEYLLTIARVVNEQHRLQA